jgi:hypothetical protein
VKLHSEAVLNDLGYFKSKLRKVLLGIGVHMSVDEQAVEGLDSWSVKQPDEVELTE